MLRLYYEDYDFTYELILIIIEEDKTYQMDLKFAIEKYMPILQNFVTDGAVLLDLLRCLLTSHENLHSSLKPLLGDALKTAQGLRTIFEDLSKVYAQYFFKVTRVCHEITEFICTPLGHKFYNHLMSIKNDSSQGLTYVQVLSKPKKRLAIVANHVRRITEHARADEEGVWMEALKVLNETLQEAKDMVETLPSEPEVNWKRYDVKSKNVAAKNKDGVKLYHAILRKICKDEEMYQSNLEKFLRRYGDLLTVEVGGQLVEEFVGLVSDLLDAHWRFKTLLETRTELKPSVDVFHQVLSLKSKLGQLYVRYFTLVLDLSLEIIRCFSSRPLLYEKLLRARNEDESWESYSYLMVQPKVRLQELEIDLSYLILLFNGQNNRFKFIECLVEVRTILKSANPPLQETLAPPTKEQLKRRAKEAKKSSKRKLNHSVYEIQTGLVKRHRFCSVTSLANVRCVKEDKSNAAILELTH